jgi:tetratricopeptide (TPR) repeat protein
MKRVRIQPFLAVALGLATLLVVAEFSLRVVGWCQQPRPSGADDAALTVLTLGDSYTYCPGVPPAESWPAQLERLLEGREPGAWRVVNRGANGQNTSTLLAELPDNLERYQPDVVVLMTGGANTWDLRGYRRHLQGDSLVARLVDGLLHIRLVKLAVLVLGEPTMPALQPVGDQGPPDASVTLAPGEPPPDDPMAAGCMDESWELFHLAQGLVDAAHYDSAVELYTQAIAISPDCAEISSSVGLVYIEIHREVQARELLVRAIDLDPTKAGYYGLLARVHQTRSDPVAASQVLVRGLATPATERNAYEKPRLMAQLLSVAGQEGSEAWLQAQGQLRALSSEHPDMQRWLDELEGSGSQREGIVQWAADDITTIVLASQRQGAEVILMSYPLRHPRDWFGLFEELARELRVHFVDNLRSFERHPEHQQMFQPDGHCNELGNAYLAENVLQALGSMGQEPDAEIVAQD